ncbi:lon protease-like protein 1 [Hibiscus syriacus]|uniref:Lon protease-like protein 1 n=1 Tax=Hibiscus syriacus TaxID=106335 RepID=A0A6A3CI54_HIBSY|nr:lon protease-like protein 1 [Hibiscus syriacus]
MHRSFPSVSPCQHKARCMGRALPHVTPHQRKTQCMGCAFLQRELVGEETSSRSGQFTLLNCFDMGSGSVACVVKEGVKLYFYNIRSAHVERARNVAIERVIEDAVSQGMAAKEAAKLAQTEGKKAAKLATRQAKRIIGPVIASGWDFFEAIYYGGTIAEGFLRGTGTLFGAYGGGFLGEQRLGRSVILWEVIWGVGLVSEASENSYVFGNSDAYESSPDESSESQESENREANVYEKSDTSEDSDVKGNSDEYESPPDESSESEESSTFW